MSDTPETDKLGNELVPLKAGENDFVSALKNWRDLCRKLERERDESRKERNAALSDRDAWARLCGAVDCYTPSTAEPYEALKLQRDALRAKIERLKADNGKYNGAVLVELAELKTDKARLDWLENLDCDSPFWGALCDTTDPRKAIDEAMKGAE